MKATLLLTLSLISLQAFSQTDIIEMRSRNASLSNYASMKSHNRSASNFGMRAMEEVKNAVLDSVICVSDSVAIMYTSKYCTGMHVYRGEYEYQKYRDSSTQIYSNPRVGSLWQPGADTVLDHPLFRHRHALDSIKEELDDRYYFYLPSDSTTFVGFDNGQQPLIQDEIKPIIHKRKQNKNSFGWELMFMIVTPIAFLLGISRLKFIGY